MDGALYAEPLGSVSRVSVESGGSSPSPSTFYDSTTTESTGANQWDEFIASPRPGATVVNLNPEIATLDQSTLRLTRVTDGLGVLEFSFGSIKSRVTYNIVTTPGRTQREFVEYTAGTVARHLEDQIQALLDSDAGKRDLAYFSTINHASGTYTPNPNCWARDVDMSFLSVGTSHGYDSNYTTQRPGCLITPRHVVVADHYQPEKGQYMRFLTPEGVLRTVTVTGESAGFRDQKVLTLSADVTGCNPAKVGGDWMTQRSGQSYYAGGIVICLDKHRQMGLGLLGSTTSLLSDGNTQTFPGVPISGQSGMSVKVDGNAVAAHPAIAAEPDLTYQIVGGDSGSPCIAVVDGSPVIITCWLGVGYGPCTWVGSGSNELLNAMIAQADTDAGVSTGYTVTQATNPTA